MSDAETWPALSVDSWTETRDSLQLWLQVVGKMPLVSTPPLNHWWNVTFQVSARGLRTDLMFFQQRGFDAEFDFVEHQLVLRCDIWPSPNEIDLAGWDRPLLDVDPHRLDADIYRRFDRSPLY